MVLRNADRNYRYAYFGDLHIAQKKEELLRLLIGEQSPKRLKT
jgi:hypothetical protein